MSQGQWERSLHKAGPDWRAAEVRAVPGCLGDVLGESLGCKIRQKWVQLLGLSLCDSTTQDKSFDRCEPEFFHE